MRMHIKPCEWFDTAYESGCIATTAPDHLGNFDGLDSEGYLVQFNTRMITRVYARAHAREN